MNLNTYRLTLLTLATGALIAMSWALTDIARSLAILASPPGA